MKSSLPQTCPADPGAAKRWRREAFPSGKTRRRTKKEATKLRNDRSWVDLQKQIRESRAARMAARLLDPSYRPGQAGCRR